MNLYGYVGGMPTYFVDTSGLRKGSWIPSPPQSQFWINDDGGTTYDGNYAGEFGDALDDIEKKGCKIKKCIVKGHGGPEGVYDDNNDAFVWTQGGGSVNVGGNNKLNTLQNITDDDSHISLRGCNTSPAASNLANQLQGPTTSGSPTPIFGLPFTPLVFGPVQNFDGSNTGNGPGNFGPTKGKPGFDPIK